MKRKVLFWLMVLEVVVHDQVIHCFGPLVGALDDNGWQHMAEKTAYIINQATKQEGNRKD